MIAEKAGNEINDAVCYEYSKIVEKYGASYNSDHEAYGVLLEEIQEAEEALEKVHKALKKLWDGIRNNSALKDDVCCIQGNAIELAQEAVQIAAVCQRYYENFYKEENGEGLF